MTYLSPLRITLIYLLLGFLWIAFSDYLLVQWAGNPGTLGQLQTVKGWFYVLVTSLLLFLLIHRYKTGLINTRRSFNQKFDQYKALIEHADQVIIQIDQKGVFQYVNPNIREITGYNTDAFFTVDDLEDLVHPGEEQHFSAFREQWKTNQAKTLKCRVRLRLNNGDWRWFLLVVYDEMNLKHVESWVLIIRDIEEETKLYNELNETYRRLHYHINNTPLGFVEWDENFRVKEWSKESERIFGWKKKEVLGKHPGDWPFVHPEDKKKVEEIMSNLLSGVDSRNVLQSRNLTRRGDIVDCEWHNSVLMDDRGSIDSIMSLVHDVTDKVRALKQIKDLNLTLEKRVKERTRELESVNRELESFAYSVSHDLRTPLRGMDSFSQALMEQYGDRFEGKGKEYLQRVRSASRKMGSLIDDILALSRINRYEFQKEEVDLSQMSNELAASLRDKEPDKKTDIRIADNLIVSGDARLLRIMMQNLLENAWKFSSEQASICIEVGEEKVEEGEKGNPREIYIKDNGVGFNMKYYDKLFSAFQRLHSSEKFPGTGIGLATVQRVMHRHNGVIRAESAEGKGSTFYLAFPETRNPGTRNRQ